MGRNRQKIISIIASFFLILQSWIPYFTFVIPAYAQSTPEEIKSEIEFNADKNEFKVSVNTKEEVEYVLSYQTNEQTEAITGKAEVSDENFEKEFFAGTCSTDGDCIDHEVLRGILKTKVASLDFLNVKRFTLENGSFEIVLDEEADSLDFTDDEKKWLTEGEDLSPPPTPTPTEESASTQEGEILDGIYTVATATPTPEIQEEQPQNNDEVLTATIVDNIDTSQLILQDDTLVFDPSASLSTDKQDYTPSEQVVITGQGFEANTNYTLTVSSTDEPAVSDEIKITTLDDGSFIYIYQLDGNYRPNYTALIVNTNLEVIAKYSFTDAALSKPENTKAIPLSNASIRFEWKDKSSEEDDFHVERKLGADSFSEIAVVPSTTTAGINTVYSIEDTGLACDTEYTYRVRAHKHSDNTFSSYGPDNNGKDRKTLYISTNDVSDLTPDFATVGSTNVPIISFTLTSCKSSAEIQRVDVEYIGDDKNDLVNMKLYQENGSVPGSFDSSSDTLRATKNTPTGGSYEFQINPSDITIEANTVQFYITADIDAGATNGNKVDARVFNGSVKINPNNPGEAENDDWPFTAELGLWNPSGETTIGSPPDTTAPTDPQDVQSTSHNVDEASSDNTIDMAWTVAGVAPGATDDDSGVYGYSYQFTTGATDTPDTTKDLVETEVGVTSDTLIDGSWYFHLRTVDNAENWTSTVHVGPFVIDTTAPAVPTLASPADGAAIQPVAFSQTWTAETGAVQYRYQSCNVDPGDLGDTCTSVKYEQLLSGTTKNV